MWDYVYGTKLQHALALARRMLAHQHGTKQIIVVTDGEPTAHIDDYGEVFFNYPPIPETLHRTMAEVIRCTRAGIIINCFALDLQRTHYPFVEQIARVNGGRPYTTPDVLGGYVLVDFFKHRRVLARRLSARTERRTPLPNGGRSASPCGQCAIASWRGQARTISNSPCVP